MRKLKIGLLLVSASLALSFSALGQSIPYYKIVDLGPVGTTGLPNSINDNNDVAGTAIILRSGANRLTPVLWKNGTMQILGPMDSIGGEAFKVNNQGHVVGYYTAANQPNGAKKNTAFFYDGTNFNNLPPILSDDTARATDVNDSDVIVGISYGSASGGGGFGNGVPVRWTNGVAEQIDQDYEKGPGSAWYYLARSRWLLGAQLKINNQGTIVSRFWWSGWANVYPSPWNYAYNYYPDSWPVVFNETTKNFVRLSWPWIGDCFPPNNSFDKTWDYAQPVAITDEKRTSSGAPTRFPKIAGVGNRCKYIINSLGGYIQENIGWTASVNSTDYTVVDVSSSGAQTNYPPHSYAAWDVVPGNPACNGGTSPAYNSALYGINYVVASGGQERLVSVGSHSKAINCSLSTGATTERAIARYEGDSTIYELSTRTRSDCGWSLGRATGINTKGVIVGKGVKSGISGTGAYRAFLLIPTDTLPATKEEGCLDAPPSDNSDANGPPTADAGPDKFVEASSPQGSTVTLDGSGSSDPDNDALTYSWTWPGGSATGILPQVQLPIGTTTVTLTVSDGNGGTDSDSAVITVQDTGSPTVICGYADGKWHGQDVTITCTAEDAGSGLSNSADASFTLHTSVPANTEDANAPTDSRQVCDKAGNCITAGPITGNMIDKKYPNLSCGSTDGMWHGSDASVACTASDGGSGLANASDASFGLTTSVPLGTETANATTDTREVCDAVGNCATAGPVSGNKVDKKAPLVSCGAADGNWHQSDVTIACTVSDSGSGLANAADASFGLSTLVAAGTETSSAATGTRNVCDAAGNCSTAGPIGGNKIDKQNPQVTIDSPMGNFVVGQTGVTANYSCTDGGSGMASCSGAIASGASMALNTPGSFNFTVTAIDAVGNTSSQSRSYTVSYNICDVVIPGSVNSGRTIPIRLRICDAVGNASRPDLVVTALGVVQVSANADAPLADAGNANPDMNFRYANDSVGYIFNLQTTGFPTGTFLLKFKAGADPTMHSVSFQVR